MNDYQITVEDLADYLVTQIRRSTREQGHYLSGGLDRSTAERIRETPDGVLIEIIRSAYGEALENGIPASRIPFSPGSGAKRSKFIEGLLDYVKRRNLKPKRGQTQLGIAFAIANKMKATGFPLVGSKRFSKTGRRTGAIREMYDREKRYIRKQVEELGLLKIEEIALESLRMVESSPYVTITQIA